MQLERYLKEWLWSRGPLSLVPVNPFHVPLSSVRFHCSLALCNQSYLTIPSLVLDKDKRSHCHFHWEWQTCKVSGDVKHMIRCVARKQGAKSVFNWLRLTLIHRYLQLLSYFGMASACDTQVELLLDMGSFSDVFALDAALHRWKRNN